MASRPWVPTDERAPIIILNLAAGYTNCVASDIGKQVEDDGEEIGPLFAYDNAARIWRISSTSVVADASVMSIAGGTGAGIADGNSAKCARRSSAPSATKTSSFTLVEFTRATSDCEP